MQKTFLLVKLDKITAGLINFVFEIGNTLSISMFNLDTLLKTIVFYIIQINIYFLLYFTDIDKFEAFCNNLTNKIIQSNCLHSVICRYDHVFLF